MFLAGSIGDLVLTLAFIPILYVHCPLLGAWAFLIFFQDKVPFVPSESCVYYFTSL